MRVLIQRVASASVEIDGEVISQIKQGLLVFYCAMKDDSVQQNRRWRAKLSIFGSFLTAMEK